MYQRYSFLALLIGIVHLSFLLLENNSSPLDVPENPIFQKHKEQSPRLIEALLTPKTSDRSTSVVVVVLSVGFPTGVMKSLCAGESYTGEAVLYLGLVEACCEIISQSDIDLVHHYSLTPTS